MIYFTSDQHFGHKNLLLQEYCNRPFSSVEEMDEEMIKRWNECVKHGDLVYHLGDFTLGVDVYKYLSRLNGRIIFVTVPFHHDKKWISANPNKVIYPMQIIKPKDMVIVLCHYPIAVWDRQHYGSVHLYGHIHNKEYVLPGFSMNVGVDHHNFYPVSLPQVTKHMENLGWHIDWKAEYIK